MFNDTGTIPICYERPRGKFDIARCGPGGGSVWYCRRGGCLSASSSPSEMTLAFRCPRADEQIAKRARVPRPWALKGR